MDMEWTTLQILFPEFREKGDFEPDIYKGLNKEERTILTSVGICPQASERPKMISKHDWNEWYCEQNKSVIPEQMHPHNIPATPHCGGWVLHEGHN